MLSISIDRDDITNVTLHGVPIKLWFQIHDDLAFQSINTDEIQAVVKQMRSNHWDVGCLYNQETAETPQLFFSHMFKTGDSVSLARQIRAGLNFMSLSFQS